MRRCFHYLVPVLSLWVTWVAGCSRPPVNQFQGYIEGEFVYVSAPLPGTLEQRPVERGLRVAKGDLLFALEGTAEKAAFDEARQRLAQAEAGLANLRKGRRPSEIASLEARLRQSQIATAYWDEEFARKERLHAEKAIPIADLDQVRSQRDTSRAQTASLSADLETARLGGREDEIRGAEAQVETARAGLARAQWALDQKRQAAPVSGIVHEAIFRVGEFVSAGTPVISLLPPENIKVRFFVPEPRLKDFPVGATVTVFTSDTNAPRAATVNFISTQPEFTPPVLYNRENRAKLVYLVEAKFAPQDARALRPGQPVDVRRD